MALAGYVVVQRTLRSLSDADSITSAVRNEGLEAVTDIELRGDAVAGGELGPAIDVADLESSIEEADEFFDPEE
ncbi:hypothetical protein [Natronobacterium gregoryi]|uniref:Uncharacterized protein n=2 Tax=Natronobacterium gregoryi TaxID=44930 RepID=L0AL12_NATGS|nr:hypothetical protein Natgr_3370 [Natronobacterium gregoryi SP2]ELY72435.1 hypothetical protein C490_03788 [Natronobacterium gregoryi SP2]PLK21763.1 hypothetical protein CYV19_02705 [Natronobacterium gregoryi SP2]SFI98647.1 hypothetical protein SAMN05443661_110217 [Natronobacterium gregoryi]